MAACFKLAETSPWIFFMDNFKGIDQFSESLTTYLFHLRTSTNTEVLCNVYLMEKKQKTKIIRYTWVILENGSLRKSC